MNFLKKLSLFLLIVVISASFGLNRIDYRDGMYKNVCKDLKNNVLVYFIFVDSKVTSPWTEFDIQSTIDSLEISIRCIEGQARVNVIQLNIISDYYIEQEYATVRKNLPYETVMKSATTPSLSKGLESFATATNSLASLYIPTVVTYT